MKRRNSRGKVRNWNERLPLGFRTIRDVEKRWRDLKWEMRGIDNNRKLRITPIQEVMVLPKRGTDHAKKEALPDGKMPMAKLPGGKYRKGT